MPMLGKAAPDFALEGYFNGKFGEWKLADVLKSGKWAVLFTYPLDFTFVCPTEIRSFNEHYDQFREMNCEVFGISTDSKFSHKAWIEQDPGKGGLGALRFPLLSDTGRDFSEKYDVLIPGKGFTYRGVFVVDPQGKVRYQLVHDTGIGRSTDEIVRVVQALQSGELCPAGWKPGEKTLGKA
ncbi:MAG: peroxiredoxin [Polyangiaceae bacterium]